MEIMKAMARPSVRCLGMRCAPRRYGRAMMHVKFDEDAASPGKDAFANDDILTEQGRREQERVTWIGLASNVGLSLAKGYIGIESGSHALVADAFHSASDLCGDIVALAALNFAKKPADDEHPYGYGHYESLATLAMSIFLIGGGVGIGYNAFEHLLLLGNEQAAVPELVKIPQAVGIIGFSVMVKEWLYRVTVDIGRRTKSPVLGKFCLFLLSFLFFSFLSSLIEMMCVVVGGRSFSSCKCVASPFRRVFFPGNTYRYWRRGDGGSLPRPSCRLARFRYGLKSRR